ncbi:helix-turn-helix domain-containing protein [Poseidonibacter lekithochrous]|uniref:helix-turn-helix domain-containing protein n=1 Tax=Poseidonibacter lekithochrous TaxID=1904463 RepID=UPI000D3AA35C|nr:helix-turn-helix transcriptional regulator [Poseidonibacter lekithochrous]
MINNEKQNTLIIPQGLDNQAGVKQIFKYQNNSTILYKCLDYNLINLEFYTHTHCIVYNCNGVETITSYDFTSVDIGKAELLFLPKDMHLISDFISNNKSLEAYMFFINDDIVDKFIADKKIQKSKEEKKVSFYKMNVNDSVLKFIESLTLVSQNQYDSKQFLELKLLELLYIIDAIDDRLVQSLIIENKDKEKRNIKSLMKKYYLSNFTMNEYALLSGRSLSTFHRDFKKHNNTTPKQYLLDLKLEYSKNQLESVNKTVSEISSEIGYENVSHFIKAFKSKYNITPKQISKNQL